MNQNTNRGKPNIIIRWLRGMEGAPAQPKSAAAVLRVTSHVARDLLQNAAYFNSVPKAVTEYVTNAIDNAPPGQSVHCTVRLSRETIRIADDASGMTRAELDNFFQMHGENVQRKRGRAVRGKFGTGKSAAFGIASTLKIETVKDGKRNVVELRRADVQAAHDGQPIPVRELVLDEATTQRAGTTIVAEDLLVKNIDPDATRAYLERTLGRHLRVHHVTVNEVACKYREPVAVKSYRYRAPREIQDALGNAVCVLKISKEPLTRDENTVAVLSGGFLHATTLAGKQGEPFTEYIFGEVEVPRLDEDTSPIPAFDNTRSLTLNPQNPLVQTLTRWLAECIAEVQHELIERDKRRRYSKEMRVLRKVSGEIETFLNEDFRVVQETMPWATMPGARRRAKRTNGKPRDEKTVAPAPPRTLYERGRSLVNRLLGARPDPSDAAQTLETIRRGGRVQFEINFVRMGVDAPRARYLGDRRAIYLNRDHPQIRTAEREAGLAGLTFKMLLFDIAFTEYALAVVSQLADQGVEIADPIDASEIAQEILERLNRKAGEKFFNEQTAREEEEEPDEEVEPESASSAVNSQS